MKNFIKCVCILMHCIRVFWNEISSFPKIYSSLCLFQITRTFFFFFLEVFESNIFTFYFHYFMLFELKPTFNHLIWLDWNRFTAAVSIVIFLPFLFFFFLSFLVRMRVYMFFSSFFSCGFTDCCPIIYICALFFSCLV